MRFADLLKQYTAGKTIDEIVAGCEEYGVKLNPSTFSQMRNGTRPAPKGEAVVRAIARVCGQDPEPLLLLSRVERNPAEAYASALGLALDTVGGYAKALNSCLKWMEAVETIAMGEHPGSEVRAFILNNPTTEMRPEIQLTGRTARMFFNLVRFLLPDEADQDRRTGHASYTQLTIEDWSDMMEYPETRVPSPPDLIVPMKLSEDDLISELSVASGVPVDALRTIIKAFKVTANRYQRPRFVPPRTPIETTLAAIAEEMLQEVDIGVHDDLYNLSPGRFDADKFLRLAREAGLRFQDSHPARQWRTIEDFAESAAVATPELFKQELDGWLNYAWSMGEAMDAAPKPPYVRPDYVGPRNDIEAKLIEVFSRNGAYDRLGVHDDLLRLAPDSTTLMRALAGFADSGLKLNSNYRKGWHTVAELAQMVDWRRNEESPDSK